MICGERELGLGMCLFIVALCLDDSLVLLLLLSTLHAMSHFLYRTHHTLENKRDINGVSVFVGLLRFAWSWFNCLILTLGLVKICFFPDFCCVFVALLIFLVLGIFIVFLVVCLLKVGHDQSSKKKVIISYSMNRPTIFKLV